MGRNIDCLFIGHNEMPFEEYEKSVASMGTDSGAYRDLNLNFIKSGNKLFTVSGIYNHFNCGNGSNKSNDISLFSSGNTFSATIAYLGTFLKRRELSFDFVNSFQDEKEALAQMLRENNILTVAIPTTFYVSAFPILEVVSFVRKHNSSAKIIIGGPFIATQVRTQEENSIQFLFKSLNADFYINSSQGESALSEIIKAIKNGAPFDRICNIWYKTNGKYLSTNGPAEDNRLDQNMVDWSLFKDRITRIVNLRTAISCPFSCSFCAFPQHAGKYQTVSVCDIERELDSIEALCTVTCVNFIDDTLNIPVERFKDFLRMLIRKKYSFKWNCNFRCQFADREMVELMKESGCQGVFLGIESGSSSILLNMNKAATVEKYREGMSLLKEVGITTYASVIIGFPGETLETVKETVDFIEEYQPDFFRTQLWYCDPFTPIWEQRDKFNIRNSQFEWSHETMNSHTACDLIDEIFCNVKNSIWVPQCGFEFLGIFNLLDRGMSIEQVKNFLTNFNNGIKEKLRNRGDKEVSRKIMERFGEIFNKPYISDAKDIRDCSRRDEKYSVDFDF